MIEFAITIDIDEEPAFSWWIPYTLRRRDKIIAKLNKRIKKISHKYGVKIPTSIERTDKIDTANGSTF